jgi:RimJ/RimL family protein N-acetyltransferase
MSPVVVQLRSPLAGRVVVLEPLDHRHGSDLLAAAVDPDVWRYMPIAGLPDAAAVTRWIDKALAAQATGREEPFAIVERATGKAVGSTRFLDIRPEERALEIGWTWLAYDRQHAGLNLEMKYLMLAHAFEERAMLRVAFYADARNARSRTALRTIGAQYEGTLRLHRARPVNGFARSSTVYSIIAPEWPAVKAGLERRFGS